MRQSKGHSADTELTKILDALAPVLIPLDVTPSRLAQIARASFVRASAEQAQMKGSGRPHLAKIAAVTGLSRSEVKKLVAAEYKTSTLGPEYSPRALRVLDAWRSASSYMKGGKPRQLSIRGQSPSFESLCKEYSGDIPYTVILDDLKRRECVEVSKQQNKVTIVSNKRTSKGLSRGHSALAFAASFLSDALKHELALVRRRERIASSSNLSDAYVETAISSRLSDLLDQLPGLFVQGKAKRRNIVNVYTLVSRNRQKS